MAAVFQARFQMRSPMKDTAQEAHSLRLAERLPQFDGIGTDLNSPVALNRPPAGD